MISVFFSALFTSLTVVFSAGVTFHMAEAVVDLFQSVKVEKDDSEIFLSFLAYSL